MTVPRGAGLAERYAVSAVDFALAGIDEAEYAALDAILPPELLVLPVELGRVDALLEALSR
ncbi:MAG TPA: hypothetical protein VI196_06580 [Mycobacterium sp.]